ncbi:MAG: LysM peptidoglycan-binding domain-containing protein [Chitinivibrionales bacterium]|nr:LysM peptidoglycan-binding domain-containing protein [Chitinivibrionales bacterium]
MQEAQAAIAQAQAEAAQAEAAAEPAEEEPAEKRTHRVAKGECLWYIAGYSDVYGDPYQWSKLYDANRRAITNPDLIYPGQELVVVR